jgi:hypothetical protein
MSDDLPGKWLTTQARTLHAAQNQAAGNTLASCCVSGILPTSSALIHSPSGFGSSDSFLAHLQTWRSGFPDPSSALHDPG